MSRIVASPRDWAKCYALHSSIATFSATARLDSPLAPTFQRHTRVWLLDERMRSYSATIPGTTLRPLRREVNIGFVSDLCHMAAKTPVGRPD
jgi:hypothetical protein